MKKFIPLILLMIVISGLVVAFAFRTQEKGEGVTAIYNAGEAVEVYYFHFTRRCVTCIAVENKAKEAVISLYPDEFSRGLITYTSVNLEEPGSKPLADRAKVTGQALVILSEDKRIDLTAEGFMYANNNFEKFKTEVKKVMDPLVNTLK